ncbi:respiratory nitrate reductase subunit gamma (plasmid) [Pseudomonas nitroreducens]|uniref:respiratory nitrate reductase subunit gamma n=1 Tax=Pseudomonas TaxID=286 RepID=UPI0009D9F866|nr:MULTISPECIES: respiratory nitrate reductase subunit gamma [unclassified Pseudomonas]OQR33016.1 respiratory nitrate reductase subunit gamma [Pseudomonas sp. T]MBD9504271.1 respiratory nitrate reductase subunit gamma [Pseudomonas sp. PDM17]MBD9516242.1 respiratory nitrate reductase subunit gamma [Pseudomonas sp. PDM22]MBD9630101.1 respiratory nitrate reductase subunit gamma [Pseudomonas sp. PDM19]MBD9684281.1 respiratory nitrate reductase subunit gamma [Pseudomonas sp. PDM20]
MFEQYLLQFIYGIYPYLAGTVFLIGSLMRYDYGQYTWKTGSSQMLSSKHMRLASNLFHIGILAIFGGHLVGLLTPHWVYAPFLSAGHKQLMAIIFGGIAGVLCVIGGAMLLWRRLTNPRVRASSSVMDNLIIALLLLQACLGLTTIFESMDHLDGGMMLALANWAQAIVFFRGGAADFVMEAPLIFKLHIFIGLTIILLFPFTRLVHVWSIPLGYFGRNYQIVRRRG